MGIWSALKGLFMPPKSKVTVEVSQAEYGQLTALARREKTSVYNLTHKLLLSALAEASREPLGLLPPPASEPLLTDDKALREDLPLPTPKAQPAPAPAQGRHPCQYCTDGSDSHIPQVQGTCQHPTRAGTPCFIAVISGCHLARPRRMI